jgi:MFS family permease
MSPENPAIAAAANSRIPEAFRSLRHRNFQLFFAGQLTSLIGTWMQSVAQAWLIYRITGSAFLLGAGSFIGQSPVFLMSPLGGVVADRYNRRQVIIVTQTISMILAFILAALTLLHWVRVWEIFVLAAMLGTVNAVDIPARQAFLVDMVGKEDLMNAIALNSSMFNGARIVGPAIAGVMVAALGEGWCFFGNGVSFLAVIVSLLLMRLKAFELHRTDSTAFQHIIEGFDYVRQTAPIRALLTVVGVSSLLAMPYLVLMPLFADRVLHGGARALGILMGATGMGAVLGAFVLASRRGVRGLGRVVGLAAAGFGVSLILFSFSRNFWLSVSFLVPAGFCMLLQNSSANTLIQTMVPDHLRGRVMSVYSMTFLGFAPVGALIAGAAAGHIGAPWTVAIGGSGCVVSAMYFHSRLAGLRGEARELILSQGIDGAEPPAVSARDVSR